MSVSLPRLVAASLRQPDPLPGDPGLLRTLAARPIVFDLLSTGLQWRDARRLASLATKDAASQADYEGVYKYNLGVTSHKVITRTRRAERLIPALTLPRRDLGNERVLLVGPRNMHEFLQLWVAGFRWKNIEGIDLYSVNKKIQIMNMEAMTFPDATFDAVFSSATVSYAMDVRQAVHEFIRILKPGGRGAFTHTNVLGESNWPGNRVSGDAIAEWISEFGGEIYFKNVSRKQIATNQDADISELAFVRKR